MMLEIVPMKTINTSFFDKQGTIHTCLAQEESTNLFLIRLKIVYFNYIQQYKHIELFIYAKKCLYNA